MIFATFLTNPGADAIIVVLVVLLFFGPKRLGPLGKSLGEGMREFKDSITGKSGSDSEDERPAVPEATAQPVSPPPVVQAPPAERPVPAAPPEPQATEPAPPADTAPQTPPPVASSERRS